MSSHGFRNLMASGMLTEDPDNTYQAEAGDKPAFRYKVQRDSNDLHNSGHFWSEPTHLGPHAYLKSIEKEYPRAVVLKKLHHHDKS